MKREIIRRYNIRTNVWY